MAYIDQTRRPSPASMAGVIGVHAAIGAALIAGLTVADVIKNVDTPIKVTDIRLPLPPEPTPEPTTDAQAIPDPVPSPLPYAPRPPIDFPRPTPDVGTTDVIPIPRPNLPRVGNGSGTIPRPLPSVTPTLPPAGPSIGAKPRNDPAGWISTSDYRSSWINREMTGTARFRLEIATSGRVTNCTITGSTGHSALDEATCRLLQQRARFQPARTGSGDPIAGSYESAVRWVLPD